MNRPRPTRSVDASALWILGDTPVNPVLDAAVDLIVAGTDAAALRELAGMSDADDPVGHPRRPGGTLRRARTGMLDAASPETTRLALREPVRAVPARPDLGARAHRPGARAGGRQGGLGRADPLLDIGVSLDEGRSTPHEAQLAAIDWATGYLAATSTGPEAVRRRSPRSWSGHDEGRTTGVARPSWWRLTRRSS